jgi:phenylacetate-coenzyme A ligase PaaK-like adenylate-forming protein
MRIGYEAKRLADMGAALRASRGAAARERWSRDQLETFQQERFGALARHAAARSPFWRDRLATELAQVPVLDKATMMERFDDVVTDRRLRRDELARHVDGITRDELHLGGYRVMATSGSSGRRGLYVYDRPAWVGLLGQFLRYAEWAGNRPSVPRRRVAAVVAGRPAHMTRRVAASANVGLHKVLPLSATTPVPDLVAGLNAFRPDFVNAYPSVAAQLADEQLAGRLRLELRGLSTSSELLTAAVRERLEHAFGVRVTDLYGTTEGLWGSTCPEEGGLHLYEDNCIVENVDEQGRPVPDGEPGSRLLVTNLFNRAQPLIRFELTDSVTFETAPCGCGRPLRRLRAVEGRTDDVLRVGGVTVHPLQFAFLTADPAVRQFQVVQQGERVRLRVVVDDDRELDRLGARMTAQLRETGVAAPAVDVERVAGFERPASGKLQLVVADRG